ncbi:WbqC-like protein family protein [compost metagenome]
MLRVCVHQPDFAPYLGFFHRLLTADVFIVMDDVQFLRRGWHHRDKIKTPQGERWLTLSIEKGDYLQTLDNVRLAPPQQGWVEANLNSIRENYRKARHFERYFPALEAIYRSDAERLVPFNMRVLAFLMQALELHVDLRFSSEFKVPGTKSERLINLVTAVGGTHYYTGIGSRSYLDEALFNRAGLAVEWQDFNHPTYPQLHGAFIPYLSTLDLLFNCGPQAREVLRTCLVS